MANVADDEHENLIKKNTTKAGVECVVDTVGMT